MNTSFCYLRILSYFDRYSSNISGMSNLCLWTLDSRGWPMLKWLWHFMNLYHSGVSTTASFYATSKLLVVGCIFESKSFLDRFMLIRNIEMFLSLLSFLIPPLPPSLCLPLGFWIRFSCAPCWPQTTLCSWGWPRTSDCPFSTSWVLRLQA